MSVPFRVLKMFVLFVFVSSGSIRVSVAAWKILYALVVRNSDKNRRRAVGRARVARARPPTGKRTSPSFWRRHGTSRPCSRRDARTGIADAKVARSPPSMYPPNSIPFPDTQME
jgi:hypothetical protein